MRALERKTSSSSAFWCFTSSARSRSPIRLAQGRLFGDDNKRQEQKLSSRWWELGAWGGTGDFQFFGRHVYGDVGEEWGA